MSNNGSIIQYVSNDYVKQECLIIYVKAKQPESCDLYNEITQC